MQKVQLVLGPRRSDRLSAFPLLGSIQFRVRNQVRQIWVGLRGVNRRLNFGWREVEDRFLVSWTLEGKQTLFYLLAASNWKHLWHLADTLILLWIIEAGQRRTCFGLDLLECGFVVVQKIVLKVGVGVDELAEVDVCFLGRATMHLPGGFCVSKHIFTIFNCIEILGAYAPK